MIEGVYIGLGSNVGDREAALNGALAAIGATRGVHLVRCSRFYETEPVGGPPGQGPYLNAVCEIATSRSPRDLLRLLLAIEQRFGRERHEPNGPRTLDLDLLLFGSLRMNEPGLIVPHPRMAWRTFVLDPLGELNPQAAAAIRGAPLPATFEASDVH